MRQVLNRHKSFSLSDKSDLTLTSTTRGVCDFNEETLNSAIFLVFICVSFAEVTLLGHEDDVL